MIPNQMVKWVMPAGTQPQTLGTGSFTATNAHVDTAGFSHATAIFMVAATTGAITDGSLLVQESDTTTDGDFATITTPVTSVVATEPGAGDDNKLYTWEIPLGGTRKRYLRVRATEGSSVAGIYGVLWCLSRAAQAPNTATEKGVANNILIA